MNYSLDGQSSERLRFRKLEDRDFDVWLTFFQDPSSNRYLFLPFEDQPIKQCELWFERARARIEENTGAINVLVLKSTNEVVGQCGLLIQRVDDVDQLEIGYWILPEHRGKGYASEASQKCRDFAFQHKLSESIISIVYVDNAASEKVARNNGMVLDRHTDYREMPVMIFKVTA